MLSGWYNLYLSFTADQSEKRMRPHQQKELDQLDTLLKVPIGLQAFYEFLVEFDENSQQNSRMDQESRKPSDA